MNQINQTETKSAKGSGFSAGCLGGGAAGGCFIGVGVLLCFTGIGAIVGVPIILMGLLAPFLGSLIGLGSIKGPCPYCGSSVTSTIGQVGVDCPACKKRIVIKDKKFFQVD
jgi:DNA-directed RNA polymerase subunit RPC12/RpoP